MTAARLAHFQRFCLLRARLGQSNLRAPVLRRFSCDDLDMLAESLLASTSERGEPDGLARGDREGRLLAASVRTLTTSVTINQEDVFMLCPKCGRSTRVIKTNLGDENTVNRVRWCQRCELTFKTRELTLASLAPPPSAAGSAGMAAQVRASGHAPAYGRA